MKQILVARTSQFEFVSEREARWLAVKTLLISTRYRLIFNDLMLGALGNELSQWTRDNLTRMTPAAKLGYQTIATALDPKRIEYLKAESHWPKICGDELFPLGIALEFMLKGHGKAHSIQKAINTFRLKRADMSEFRKNCASSLPDTAALPSAYRNLSTGTFEKRFKSYETVLPYVYIYYRRFDHQAWAAHLPPSHNPLISPGDFPEFANYMWDRLLAKRTIRMRPPSQPILLEFQ